MSVHERNGWASLTRLGGHLHGLGELKECVAQYTPPHANALVPVCPP
jgi:hypothetical protein